MPCASTSSTPASASPQPIARACSTSSFSSRRAAPPRGRTRHGPRARDRPPPCRAARAHDRHGLGAGTRLAILDHGAASDVRREPRAHPPRCVRQSPRKRLRGRGSSSSMTTRRSSTPCVRSSPRGGRSRPEATRAASALAALAAADGAVALGRRSDHCRPAPCQRRVGNRRDRGVALAARSRNAGADRLGRHERGGARRSGIRRHTAAAETGRRSRRSREAAAAALQAAPIGHREQRTAIVEGEAPSAATAEKLRARHRRARARRVYASRRQLLVPGLPWNRSFIFSRNDSAFAMRF